MIARIDRAGQAGFLMIEVLITMFILVIGLLGVVGLQARAQQAETESYQRTQALMLLRDMADRINANRNNAASYVTGTAPLGTGNDARRAAAPATTLDIDQCAWSAALIGAAETTGTCDIGTGANCVGAMIGARGCITQLDAATDLSDGGGVAGACRRRPRRLHRSTCGDRRVRRGRVAPGGHHDRADRRPGNLTMPNHCNYSDVRGPPWMRQSVRLTRRRALGFSLVELMVALAIASVLLGALAVMFVNTSIARGEMEQGQAGRSKADVTRCRSRRRRSSCRVLRRAEQRADASRQRYGAARPVHLDDGDRPEQPRDSRAGLRAERGSAN